MKSKRKINALLGVFAIYITCYGLWSFGYPDPIRYPIYIFVGAVFAIFGLRAIALDTIMLLLSGVAVVLWTAIISEGTFGIFWVSAILFYSTFSYTAIKVTIQRSGLAPFKKILEKATSISITAALGLLCVDVLLRERGIFLFNKSVLPAGVFLEPSHLGFTITPLACFALARRNRWIWFAIVILIIFFLASSMSMFVSIAAFGASWILRRKRLLLISVPILIPILTVLVTESSTFKTYTLSKESSLIIWNSTLSRALSIAYESPFGVGPFSWISDSGFETVDHADITSYNERDLASSLAFIIASYGFIGIAAYIYILWVLCNFKEQDQFDERLSIVLITQLTVHEVRWSGLLLTPFLGYFLCLVAWREAQRYLRIGNIYKMP